MGQEIGNGSVNNCRGDHQPDRPRFLQLRHEVLERGASFRFLHDEFTYYLWRPIENDTLVAASKQPSDHVCSHASQTNHSKLHKRLLCRSRMPDGLLKLPSRLRNPRLSRCFFELSVAADQIIRRTVVAECRLGLALQFR